MWPEIEAWQWQHRQRERLAALTAWRVAAWSRVTADDFPALADVLAPYEDGWRPPTPEEEEERTAAAAAQWNSVLRICGELGEAAGG